MKAAVQVGNTKTPSVMRSKPASAFNYAAQHQVVQSGCSSEGLSNSDCRCAGCKKKAFPDPAFAHKFSQTPVYPVKEETSVRKQAQLPGRTRAPRQPAAGSSGCTYTITYDPPERHNCGPRRCGIQARSRIAQVTARGPRCPRSLAGQRLTEQVETDHGCLNASVHQGGECEIQADGSLRAVVDGVVTANPCADIYTLCGPPHVFAESCDETFTQTLFVGGRQAAVRHVRFHITHTHDRIAGSDHCESEIHVPGT